MKKLRPLNLSYNPIIELKGIDRLINLEELKLYNNNLEVLPLGLFELKKLRVLDVSDNKLTVLNEDIRKLSNLEELNISENIDIKELPSSIGILQNLKVLDLYETRIRKLPRSLTKLPLKELRMCYGFFNTSQITMINWRYKGVINWEDCSRFLYEDIKIVETINLEKKQDTLILGFARSRYVGRSFSFERINISFHKNIIEDKKVFTFPNDNFDIKGTKFFYVIYGYEYTDIKGSIEILKVKDHKVKARMVLTGDKGRFLINDTYIFEVKKKRRVKKRKQ